MLNLVVWGVPSAATTVECGPHGPPNIGSAQTDRGGQSTYRFVSKGVDILIRVTHKHSLQYLCSGFFPAHALCVPISARGGSYRT